MTAHLRTARITSTLTPTTKAANDVTLVTQAQPPQYDALSLTQNGKTAQITLNGMVYTLTITRAGKLILTK